MEKKKTNDMIYIKKKNNGIHRCSHISFTINIDPTQRVFPNMQNIYVCTLSNTKQYIVLQLYNKTNALCERKVKKY